MEAILLKLLVADNALIKEGTAELKKVFEKPQKAVSALCQLIVSCPNSQVRQLAAVLLRKRYGKSDWLKLPKGIREQLKPIILQALINEPETPVKSAIARFIGSILPEELKSKNWPQAVQFLEQTITSENLADQELGTFTLSIVTEISPKMYVETFDSLIIILSQRLHAMQDLGSLVTYYIIQTLQNISNHATISRTVTNVYYRMMPRIVMGIKSLAKTHEDKAVKSFELLDELCEFAPYMITANVKLLVEMCLAIANDKSFIDDLRVKAIGFLGWLIKMEKKALLEDRLIGPIVDTLFAIMSSRSNDDNEEEYFSSDNEYNTPITRATQIVDLLALHLPPDKLIPELARHMNPALEGTDPYAKKASYLVLAMLAEGCSLIIRTKYLETFLRCIGRGITDPNPVIRNAALFALGQFSEHLQPEISQYGSELLPVLLELLSEVSSRIAEEKKEPIFIDRIFYALEMFCENMQESFQPYLPILMERLYRILSNEKTSIHVKELCLSAIGSASCASKEDMMPYLKDVIALLESYITEKPEEAAAAAVGVECEATIRLRVQAVDTLGVIAKSLGEKNFGPLAHWALKYGLKLLADATEPDLKKSAFGLCASISTIMKTEMAFALPEIVSTMITSLRSLKGVTFHFKDEESPFSVYEEISESVNEEEDIENTDNEEENEDENDEDDLCLDAYSFEKSYIEEKEEALLALKEIAQYTEAAFSPYLEVAFKESMNLINYPQEDIRKAAVEAVQQFCINYSKIQTDEGREALHSALGLLVPKLSLLIRLDTERTVAMCGLDALTALLNEIKELLVQGMGHRNAVTNCIVEVMKGKTKCQDEDTLECLQDEAEQDQLLVECAGEALCAFAKMGPPNEFFIDFQSVLPSLLERAKNTESAWQRSFAIGTIAECLSVLGRAPSNFTRKLLPVFFRLANDPCVDVRNNAIFGIGEFALHGKEAVYPYYPEILNILSKAIVKETNAELRDNVLGAIARLIIANWRILPLEQVFPVFVQQLPLKEDYEEYKSVFQSIEKLYETRHRILEAHMRHLLQVAVTVLYEDKAPNEETKNLIVMFIKSGQRDFPNHWSSLHADLPVEVTTRIQEILS